MSEEEETEILEYNEGRKSWKIEELYIHNLRSFNISVLPILRNIAAAMQSQNIPQLTRLATSLIFISNKLGFKALQLTLSTFLNSLIHGFNIFTAYQTLVYNSALLRNKINELLILKTGIYIIYIYYILGEGIPIINIPVLPGYEEEISLLQLEHLSIED